MEIVVPMENHVMTYPEVTPNATRWAHDKSKPKEETVTVTAYGLRRLLRLAKRVQNVVMYTRMRDRGSSQDLIDIYSGDATDEKLVALSNELSTIWLEDDLVMSRLFVTDDGKAIAHPNKEVDDAGIPPWEKA